VRRVDQPEVQLHKFRIYQETSDRCTYLKSDNESWTSGYSEVLFVKMYIKDQCKKQIFDRKEDWSHQNGGDFFNSEII